MFERYELRNNYKLHSFCLVLRQSEEDLGNFLSFEAIEWIY